MKVRALVIGLGSIGQRHARNLRTILGPELILSALRTRRYSSVVTDRMELRAENPEADCNGGVYEDLDEALATQPDVVIVSNPTSMHLETTTAAVQSGAAIFLEKPISDRLDGVEKLGQLIAARRAVVAVGCQLRFHPGLQDLRRLLNDRAIGRLIAVYSEQGEYLPDFHPYEDYRHTYAARHALGGGVVLTQIHEIDYLQWLFGTPRRVFAVGGHISDLEIDVEDSSSVLCEHETDGKPLAVHLHLDYLQRPSKRTCRVVGEEGTIELNLRSPRLTVIDNSGGEVLLRQYPDFDRAKMFLDEMRHFLEAALEGGAVAVDFAHAADTLRTAVAIRTSLHSGELQRLT